uniref:Transposase Tc1-like domain-containing protein n=4 Tax=Aegilops tauschii subsp. strangulata TaxID=200361 RepID=A0A453JQG5_AEGTS
GRKGKDNVLSQIPTIPLNRRSTLRSLARALGVSHTTLYQKLKLRKIRRHSNRLKPSLKEKNKRERIEFCIS